MTINLFAVHWSSWKQKNLLPQSGQLHTLKGLKTTIVSSKLPSRW